MSEQLNTEGRDGELVGGDGAEGPDDCALTWELPTEGVFFDVIGTLGIQSEDIDT